MLDVRPLVTAAPDTLVELALEEGGGAVAQQGVAAGTKTICQKPSDRRRDNHANHHDEK